MSVFIPCLAVRLLGTSRYTFVPHLSALHTPAAATQAQTVLARRAIALTRQNIAIGLGAISLSVLYVPWAKNTVYCAGETKEATRATSSIPNSSTDKKPLTPSDKDTFGDSLSSFNGQQLSFGTTMGFCSGYLVKKVGKVAALTVGAGFIFVQILESQGYIQISWDRFEKGYIKALDVDKDGKVTIKDARIIVNRISQYLGRHLQMNSGFIVGFALGLRYG
ncbi:FUN14 family-domain-containing protein [Jimgerdemannia flammicorona]|uniref:FUN14 family-domain-containing protein n=1 Tax=Jimgerdemannia flammicorona TaxID=994334 RepID=A0A433DEB3_9FUNG|nr:FUN14 family-domain-containing protein [Jimgerdemannia flammicorona]